MVRIDTEAHLMNWRDPESYCYRWMCVDLENLVTSSVTHEFDWNRYYCYHHHHLYYTIQELIREIYIRLEVFIGKGKMSTFSFRVSLIY